MKDNIRRTLEWHSVSCLCDDCMGLDKLIKYLNPVFDTTVIPERAESQNPGLKQPAHTTTPSTARTPASELYGSTRGHVR